MAFLAQRTQNAVSTLKHRSPLTYLLDPGNSCSLTRKSLRVTVSSDFLFLLGPNQSLQARTQRYKSLQVSADGWNKYWHCTFSLTSMYWTHTLCLALYLHHLIYSSPQSWNRFQWPLVDYTGGRRCRVSITHRARQWVRAKSRSESQIWSQSWRSLTHWLYVKGGEENII